MVVAHRGTEIIFTSFLLAVVAGQLSWFITKRHWFTQLCGAHTPEKRDGAI